MNDSDLIELEGKKAHILRGMTEFMRAGDKNANPGYTEADIKKCDEILKKFLDSLQKLDREASRSEILECVKYVVMELNKLNEGVGHGLIETMEREDLCDYILYAAGRSGLNATEGDVTEEWREW